MSARMLSSITEEHKKDLHKQIGCMNGLFQLFDRHHFLTGKRFHGQNHKRLLTGAADTMEPKCAEQSSKEKTPREVARNKVSHSSESSKVSSKLEQSKISQQEQPFCSQRNLPESPSKTLPYKQPSSPSHSGRQSPDFRDVVKDSMHREARSLSVKTVTKVEGKVHVMKHIDSPRPFQQSNCGKPSDGTRQVTAKFREAPRNSREDLKHAPKDRPRFSYDERDSREAVRSSVRLKDLPRLSLDSREQSFRSSASESRSNFLLGDHKRSSSVVAKLMGLEAFPNSIPTNEIETPKSFSAKDTVPVSTKTAEKSKNNQVTRSPQINENDFNSPRMKSTNSIMRGSSPSRLPLEPAPWRQPEASRTSHKSSARNTDVELSIKTPKTPSSVYGEMEKRITELEFRKSGKDLRALKQILEAMQKTRARLEVQTEEQADSNVNLEIVQTRQQRNLLSPTIKGTRPPKREETADKKTRDSGWHLSSPDRKTREGTPRAVQNPTFRQQKEGSYPALGRNSGTVSPRPQQKKKQSCPITTSPEFSRVRRQSIKQSKESGSPKRRLQSKPNNLLRVDEELSENSSGTRNFSDQGDAASVQSESNNSLSSHAEGEVTSRILSFKVNAKRLEDTKDKSDMMRLNEDRPMAELAISTIEQPSPVSVLDAAFYEEDSLSPVKKKTTAFRVEDAADELWYPDYQDHSPYSTRIDGHKKLERINDLIHQLRLLDSNHEANMDQLGSLSQTHNPDHRYITKILLASGLLKEVDCVSTAIQVQSSGHLIDPKLFHILEQTEERVMPENGLCKKSAWIEFNQKMHRKNVFDIVDEILPNKLSSESCLLQGRDRLNAQQLQKELKSDIDNLNAKKVSMDSEEDELISILNADMRHQSEDWTNGQSEIPSLILDVERLIYKDLITEIISDEAREQQQIRTRRHCRQLFTN
ncbi:protein LONGIFOLIA 1-like [Lycium ferocissimum]|uniref:protein LONGIFOLIA 1-like n=1 Tax=Lycium ferocissimum TaxID=112874 RepID=UPI0028162A55|nr:protein LONGIFOLIA 1-like [Lycium ferocissimum]